MTLKPSSLKPPDQKVYITHHKAMTILDLVEISVRLNMIIIRLEIPEKHQPIPLDGRAITIDKWLNPTSIKIT